MSKKTNTLLFILGGTALNIIITILSFIILLALYGRFFFPMLPESAASWVIPIIFIASIGVSFVVYRVVIKMITKKVNMEKYFDPIFGPRRRPRPKN